MFDCDVTLKLKRDVVKTIEEMMESTGTKFLPELVRNSLAVFRYIIESYNNGDDILIRDNKTKEVARLTFNGMFEK